MQFQENLNKKVLHSNVPLVRDNDYFRRKPEFVKIFCKDQSGKEVEASIALIVTPYEAVYLKRHENCTDFSSSYQLSRKEALYSNLESLRIFKSFLYGKVEEICTT